MEKVANQNSYSCINPTFFNRDHILYHHCFLINEIRNKLLVFPKGKFLTSKFHTLFLKNIWFFYFDKEVKDFQVIKILHRYTYTCNDVI